jgi:hypothetical protein
MAAHDARGAVGEKLGKKLDAAVFAAHAAAPQSAASTRIGVRQHHASSDESTSETAGGECRMVLFRSAITITPITAENAAHSKAKCVMRRDCLRA